MGSLEKDIADILLEEPTDRELIDAVVVRLDDLDQRLSVIEDRVANIETNFDRFIEHMKSHAYQLDQYRV